MITNLNTADIKAPIGRTAIKADTVLNYKGKHRVGEYDGKHRVATYKGRHKA